MTRHLCAATRLTTEVVEAGPVCACNGSAARSARTPTTPAALRLFIAPSFLSGRMACDRGQRWGRVPSRWISGNVYQRFSARSRPFEVISVPFLTHILGNVYGSLLQCAA